MILAGNCNSATAFGISNNTRKTIDLSNNPDRHKYFSENGAEMLQTVPLMTFAEKGTISVPGSDMVT